MTLPMNNPNHPTRDTWKPSSLYPMLSDGRFIHWGELSKRKFGHEHQRHIVNPTNLIHTLLHSPLRRLPGCLHILPAVSRYIRVEVSSYRCRGGAAGVFLRHGCLIHRQPLFHRHRLGLLVLSARGPVLGGSWPGSTCAACSCTNTKKSPSKMWANRRQLTTELAL